jgi:hypothetical protein
MAQENTVAVDLTTLTNEVANNTTVTNSVVALINQLATIIKNMGPQYHHAEVEVLGSSSGPGTLRALISW